jgi:hypothetical protein
VSPSSPVDAYAHIIDLFLCGKLPSFNHARHVAVARILNHLPHGRELMHLGIQVTATRAGMPQKYSREITDAQWALLEEGLPPLSAFEDAVPLPYLGAPPRSPAADHGREVRRRHW